MEHSSRWDPVRSGQAPGKVPYHMATLIRKLQRRHAFFSGMDEKEIVKFLGYCGREVFPRGDHIFEEGEAGDAFYLITDGEVLIRTGEEEIARMGAGDVFGEMAIFDDAPRSATAEAVQDTVVLSAGREILGKVLPELGFKMVTNLAREIAVKLRATDIHFFKMLPATPEREETPDEAEEKEVSAEGEEKNPPDEAEREEIPV